MVAKVADIGNNNLIGDTNLQQLCLHIYTIDKNPINVDLE
jgi:predicted neuraminidase